MNALKLVEAVHFDPSGIPSYKKDHVTDKDRRDPEKQRFRTLPGEIVTRPRHGSSIRTRGEPDPYQVSQHVTPVRGHVGPLTAKGSDSHHDDHRKFVILTAFKRPELPSHYLDQVKLADFEGAQEMVDDAAAFLAESFIRTHFDAVTPVPSSKPLAYRLAARIGAVLNIPLWVPHWVKLGQAKKSGVSTRGDVELLKLNHDPMDVPSNVLLVDDFVTSRQTMVEAMLKLYNLGASYVAGAALCGPPQP